MNDPDMKTRLALMGISHSHTAEMDKRIDAACKLAEIILAQPAAPGPSAGSDGDKEGCWHSPPSLPAGAPGPSVGVVPPMTSDQMIAYLKSEIRAHRQAHQETSRECEFWQTRTESAEAQLTAVRALVEPVSIKHGHRCEDTSLVLSELADQVLALLTTNAPSPGA